MSSSTDDPQNIEEPSPKRVKLDNGDKMDAPTQPERQRGVAPIKREFLIDISKPAAPSAVDDDEAEAAGKSETQPAGGRGGKKTERGQNRKEPLSKISISQHETSGPFSKQTWLARFCGRHTSQLRRSHLLGEWPARPCH